MSMKKIPIGLKDYRKLKEENYYVVDKSLMIYGAGQRSHLNHTAKALSPKYCHTFGIRQEAR